MGTRSEMSIEETPETELTIPVETVCAIIQMARIIMEKVEPVDPDSGSNPTDDEAVDVLEFQPDDPAWEEFRAMVEALNEDEEIELLALVWLGRGDFTPDAWGEALETARNLRHRHVAQYLSETPRVADYLEEGLSLLNYSCEGLI